MSQASEIIGYTAPRNLNGEQRFSATVIMRNKGTTEWLADGPTPHRLGSQEPQDNALWIGNNRLPLPRPRVLPGEDVYFTIEGTAPTTPGGYPMAWRMLQEGVEWFGPTASALINVSPSVPELPDPALSNDLVSVRIFNTGPYIADYLTRELAWVNQTGHPLEIVQSYLWTGVDMGGRMDTHVELERERDRSLLNVLQWDHYADPTVPQHYSLVAYAPYTFRLVPYEALILRYFSNPMVPARPDLHAHHVGILFLRKGSHGSHDG